MVTNLVGCIGLIAAVDTLALFGCVVEVADWAGVTFQYTHWKQIKWL